MLGALTGDEVDAMDDDALGAAIDHTTIFARVGPETKARIVRVQRLHGADVAFMGDGVNDAVALHHADVGISVDTGTDVAKDAADIILLDKDLGVLADGVVEGRRIFANTIKYVLMATSSNFGNMFSAAAASAFLVVPADAADADPAQQPALRRQPDDDPDRQRRRGDAGPTVGVGPRVHPQLHAVLRAAQLDLRLRDVRRDDRVLHAHAPEFRTGWFVESLATQTLVIFVIRTRRHPFWRSRPSRPLLVASLAVPLIGVALPYMPFGHYLGFTHLPLRVLPDPRGAGVAYLVLVESVKGVFYRRHAVGPPVAERRPHHVRRIHRPGRDSVTPSRSEDIVKALDHAPLSDEELARIDAYWRAANYLTVGQIYLLDNALLRRPLVPADVKPRLLGHWGTSPGLNLIYAHLDRVIARDDLDIIYVIGPGHGGPAILANTWLEGSYTETYPAITRDAAGMQRLFRQFSFPGGVPSHVAPETPGSIHEGGELGYSLSHAFGAAFDNPDLVVACVVGDGEAETGPLATSWHSNKFLDPVGDGAVLPILHLNGYKIANPTVLARIPEDELTDLLVGCGWEPYLVAGDDPALVHQQLAATLDHVLARDPRDPASSARRP